MKANNLVIALSVFLISLSTYADPDDSNTFYEDRIAAKKIFQTLYDGDPNKLKNLYRLYNYYGADLYVASIAAYSKKTQDIILPSKHAEFCKKFLYKDKGCRLKADHFYIRYPYHEKPGHLSPITGGFMVAMPMSLYDSFVKGNYNPTGSEDVLRSISNRFYFAMGEVDYIPHYFLESDSESKYIHLVDKLEVTKENKKEIWIRFSNIKGKHPAWFNLDQLYVADSRNEKIRLDGEYLKKYMRLIELVPHYPFWIRFNIETKPKYFIALKEIGLGQDKSIEAESIESFYGAGIPCFEKIKDGRLYFKLQIAIDNKVAFSGYSLSKHSEDLVKKDLKNLEKNIGEDQIFYIKLDEYLKDNELRAIYLPVEESDYSTKCSVNTVFMEKVSPEKAGFKFHDLFELRINERPLPLYYDKEK